MKASSTRTETYESDPIGLGVIDQVFRDSAVRYEGGDEEKVQLVLVHAMEVQYIRMTQLMPYLGLFCCTLSPKIEHSYQLKKRQSAHRAFLHHSVLVPDLANPF